MAPKRNPPMRGQNQIKIKIFKMIVKSIKHLAIRLAGKPTKAAGDGGGGGGCRGCFSSPATVIPVEPAGPVKAATELKIDKNRPMKMNEIDIYETIGELIIGVTESEGEKRGSELFPGNE